MIEELAERADRAMRTYSARSIADSAYAMVRDALLSPEEGDAETRVLRALAARHNWTERSDREFVCKFGERSSVLNVPHPFNAKEMTQLITRIEVNVCLGDGVDHAMIRELQSLAQRELQCLRDADAPQ